ncbi:MAG: DEAD/DEAH box helicase [Erysipelotrichaceae bacterium]|nr:DEAD/DEAH box helicase [Erysipelotrichaceae bacterium]
MKFKQYPLSETTLKFIALNDFVEATPIQHATIKMALKHKDIIAISNTGTGKTHAFLIPLMEKIDPTVQKIQAVITAPTRELAMQIYQRAKLMEKADNRLNIKLITGGIARDKMSESIKKQPHIVIGTPGRIKDLFLDQDVLRVDTANILVVDEADMTLEYGFLEDVDAIASRMKDLTMMCFSATIPQELKPFLKKYMTHPQTIKIEDSKDMNPNIEHRLINCKHKSYQETLLSIVDGFIPYVCLVFANTRQQASECASLLRSNGLPVLELHGGLSARARKQAMKQLQNNQHSYIIASDIASRGIDIEAITHVVSLGFPNNLEFYIHRAGRCGRAGKHGICFALYKEQDDASIKELMKQGIEFLHYSYKNEVWTKLKPYGFKKVVKKDVLEKEIAKKITRKNEKVKPGYKKKKAEEVKRIKQKQRQQEIRSKIKAQRKEMYKQKQRELNKNG